MLAEAEKYASADKEKKENINLKNQAETLCSEAEKELVNFKSENSEESKTIETLIDKIREKIAADDFDQLKTLVEDLKTKMREFVATQSSTKTDTSSNLNDL